jgi:tRNA(Ile)-lysidine synthase
MQAKVAHRSAERGGGPASIALESYGWQAMPASRAQRVEGRDRTHLSALHHQIRRSIRRHGLFPARSRLLIGLSGGSDSVALVLLLQELAEHDAFTVVSLAHLNHRLRYTAARDEQFCREFAASLGLPIAVESIDVSSYAQTQRLSLEDAARRLRYDFLHRVAESASADRIAVGHTRDDQAETFLLKLIRGAGLTGLGGIYPRRGIVIRPLLDVGRADLRRYLESRGQPWVDDETNEDLGNPRNRIRHRVLPELELAAGGSSVPAIARAAANGREDGQWLDELADRRFDALVVRGNAGVEIDVSALMTEPLPVRRRVVLAALRLAAPNREIGFDHVQSALEVAAGESAGVDVPGARVELRRGKMVLLREAR